MQPAPYRPPPLPFIIATIVGLAFALFVGRMAGNGDYAKISAIIVVAIGIVVCLTLKAKIWLIIPFCWSLSGQISVLPVPFSIRELAVLVVFGLFLVFYALKLVKKSHKMGWIDLLVALNIGYLFTVFLRNPVGVSAFGSSMVGGRPYFAAFIGILAFWIFSRVTVNEKQARAFPFILFLGPLIVACLSMLAYFIPSSVPYISPFYNGIDVTAYIEGQQATTAQVGPEGSGRLASLGAVGITAVLALVSYYRPMSLVLPINPLRFIFLVSSLIGILLSGFRSTFVSAGVYMGLASHYRVGVKDVVRVLAMAFAIVAIAVLGNGHLFNLPKPIQRTLSFLPGTWDQGAVDDAQGSSEWRFRMWREVWTSDKWIKHKALGDGFGFSEYELNIMKESAWGGAGFIGGSETEAQMISGAYHSGPLSAVRYVGIVGLILYLILMIYLAIWSAKVIKAAKGTPFFPMALFIGIPLIFEPLNYCFIFGGFDSGLPVTFFNAGLMKMLAISLERHQATLQQANEVIATIPEDFSVGRRKKSRALSRTGV